jgi:ubiquinone/menaquinone biosynthesis C-methylase UbiE
MLSPARRLLKIIHPEGIPWPGTAFYNALSKSAVFQRNYELVARDVVNFCPVGSILDIGTGPGWLLLKLHHELPSLRITGIDASSSMVEKARKNIADAGLSHLIQIETGNASRLPFAEGSFDAVVSTGSMHHWKKPTSALNEVYRVLKHDGRALMYDLVSNTPQTVLDEVTREFGRLRTLLLRIHALEEPFYTRENFEALAQNTSFKAAITRFVGVQCCLFLEK